MICVHSIFNELESQDKLKIGLWSIRDRIHIAVFDSLSQLTLRASYISVKEGAAALAFAAILAIPVLCMFTILELSNLCGPIVCIGLSWWRLRQRDYHSHGVNGSRDQANAVSANLIRGLDFFYTLVLCQSVLYLFFLLLFISEIKLIFSFSKQCKLRGLWGWNRVDAYLRDTRERCEREPALLAAEEPRFINYAVGLLESESQEEYLSGARMLYILINDGEDAKSIILRSRPKIQRLLDMLGWRWKSGGSGNNNVEVRMLAATIVADLADSVQLALFPGAILSVSSLLEITSQHHLWNNNQQHKLSAISPNESAHLNMTRRRAEKAKKRREIRKKPAITGAHNQLVQVGHDGMQQQNGNDDSEEEELGCDELIVQGLRILEGLASDANNCTDICGHLGLVSKITAPLYSATLIQDIGSSEPWANIANASLKVVHQLLVHAAPAPGTKLRHEISSDKQAMSNLEGILHLKSEAPEAVGQELQMQAIEILTQLVLHSSSVNIIREKRVIILVKKQLEIFLLHGDGDNKSKSELADDKRSTAGETLLIMSKNEAISGFIVIEHNDNVDRLTQMLLDAKENIKYRTISAAILENLCTHCKEHVNQTLLPKVIAEIFNIETKPKTDASDGRTISVPGENEGIQAISSPGDDEEMQRPKHKRRNKKAHAKASNQQANEDEAHMIKLQEALLSLTLVIRDKVIIQAEIFALAVQEKSPGGAGAFLEKLKAIVDNSRRQATPVSLKIVKLCSQIATSIMRSNLCTNDQRKEFVESLSKASKTMAKLEGCVLFAGNDYRGLKKAARPLLSHLEKELKGLVA